jgi:hypothetical protein
VVPGVGEGAPAAQRSGFARTTPFFVVIVIAFAADPNWLSELLVLLIVAESVLKFSVPKSVSVLLDGPSTIHSTELR